LPSIPLSYSLLAGGPAEIFYREIGEGEPLLFLHGGWGYKIYPLDEQLQVLTDFRVIIPDRSGYGCSTKPAIFGPDLHHRATQETIAFVDAIGIEKCLFWGHSDGAVIAAMLGLAAPGKCRGLILEALHYDREKIHSRQFFETMASEPEAFGSRVTDILKSEHGESNWRDLIRNEGNTWLEIAHAARSGTRDLFDGRLSALHVPTAVIHGAQDPRTEDWELDAVRRELPGAGFHIIASGGHSPHSESACAVEFGRYLEAALAAISKQYQDSAAS